MRNFTPVPGNSPAPLQSAAVKRGESVTVMLANTPAMLEAHYGVPMAGAVLHPSIRAWMRRLSHFS